MALNFDSIAEKLYDLYRLDINAAQRFFSSTNYVFVFPDHISNCVIRLTIGNRRTRKQALSEILWIDDLKIFDAGICEPLASVNKNYLEEWDEGNLHFRATMFRKARGSFITPDKADNWFFTILGEKLGKIHKASKNQISLGFKYDRVTWYDMFLVSDETIEATGYNDEVKGRIRAVLNRMKEMPSSEDTFGLTHGDFGFNNYFVDSNNIWVFDFDAASYNFYMYDVASAFVNFLWSGMFRTELSSKDVIYKDGVLSSFRYGYEQHMKLPESQWDMLPEFFYFRLATAALVISQLEELGTMDIKAVRMLFKIILAENDVFNGLDKASQTVIQWMLGAGVEALTEVKQSMDELEDEPKEVIVMTGKQLNTNTTPELELKIESLITRGCRSLILDCNSLTYMSSYGIRLVLSTYKKLNGKLKLTGVCPSIYEVLEVTGMAELLDIERI